MMRTALALLILAVAAPARADQSASEILKKARDQGALNLVGLKADLKLTNIEKDGSQQVRELTTQSRKIDGVTKSLSRFRSPPDVAGVALLTVEGTGGQPDQVALYAPKVRRSRRIAPGARGESFMESEFSYADFTGGSLDDANPSREKDASMSDVKLYVITARPKDSPYKKVVAKIAQDTFIPMQVEYYDGDGLLKTYTVKKVEERAGRKMAVESEMVNARTGRKSVLSVGQVTQADAPDAAFTERGLERG